VGHTRLGVIPKTRSWKSVVALLGGDSIAAGSFSGPSAESSPSATSEPRGSEAHAIASLADATLQAARGGLERAKGDVGLAYPYFLLTRLALASRHEDWRSELARLGIQLEADATPLDLRVELLSLADDWLIDHHVTSDVSEIAMRALGETLATTLDSRPATLFGPAGEELRLAIRASSTRNGFAELSQRFFGNFIARFLNFYLSRISAAQLGRGAVQQLGDITELNRVLAKHCFESARIVRDFAGQWYGKTEYERGIDIGASKAFVAVALGKLQEELRLQRRSAPAEARDSDD
jgi:hypothetical protein